MPEVIQTMQWMRYPQVGDIVHYVLPASGMGLRPETAGQHRAAMVVRVWGETSTTVQLQVFLDGGNDGGNDAPYGFALRWVTSVMQDEVSKSNGTWHYPEQPLVAWG